MAEYGAHLASAAAGKPSIFEVLAQENLQQAIRPGIHYILNKLQQLWNSEQLQSILDNFNQLYTVLDLIVQHHYLKNYGGSFAEYYYGLQRVPLDGADANRYKLPLKQHIKSLLLVCFASRLKQQLDDKFEQLLDETETGQRRATIPLQIFLRLYPVFHALWQGTFLMYQIAFVFGKTPYHSPFLQLAGCHLTPFQEESKSNSSSWHHDDDSLVTKLGKATRLLVNGLSYSLSTTLTTGAFFLQYMDWWKSSNQSVPSNADIPPPAKNAEFITQPQMCPICRTNRINDTVLTTSGFVFCYMCIKSYVEANGVCPITKYPTSVNQLIRLYQNT